MKPLIHHLREEECRDLIESWGDHYLTNDECDILRQMPVDFNNMLRVAYIKGLETNVLEGDITDARRVDEFDRSEDLTSAVPTVDF